jgi:hypothetical protein
MGVPKFPKLGLLQLWGCITLCADLWSRWGLKQSCSPCQELFNNMLHATYKQGNWCNSWLLVVGSQICQFDSYPIFNIYVPKAFQWNKEIFNPMGFDPFNHSLKIWKSIGTPTPKVGAHLGMWGFIPSHSPHSQEHEMWFPTFTLGPHLCKPLPWSWS